MFRVLPFLIILLCIFVIDKAFFLSTSPVLDELLVLKAFAKDKEANDLELDNPEAAAAKGEGGQGEAGEERGATDKQAIPEELRRDMRRMQKMERAALQDAQCPYTAVEVEILQELSAKRVMLDEREKDVVLKENLLNVAERNLDAKIVQLDEMQVELRELLQKYEEKNSEKISRLVKVYEKMKPKNAAEIFETLELDILLEVAGNMKESSLANILANMNPKKARTLTTELVNYKKWDYNGEENLDRM